MSTIDGLNGNSAVSAYQYSGTNAVAGQSQSSQQGPSAAGASKFADAISAALSQVTGASSSTSTTAASSTSSTSGTSGTSDASQAEATFAQNLFAALQSPAAASSGASGAAASGTAPAGGHHHHHGGGAGGKISSGLDNLASALTASGSNTSTTDSSTDASGTTGSDPLSALQSSFNNLLAANGQSSSSASLPQFLQTLSQNLQNAPATGSVVSTKV